MLSEAIQARLQAEAAAVEPRVYEAYKALHTHPELSLQEYNTSRLVRETVRGFGGFDEPLAVGPTGLLYRLQGEAQGTGKNMLLRADMDALPILEDADHEVRSEVEGVMHACGHDTHTSILLGTMRILSRLRDRFSGTVYFFFQPAEEGLGGAKFLLNTPGVPLEDIDAVCACHMMPDLYAGEIGLQSGALLASADTFDITVNGRGGHGAHPYTTVDPVMIAASLVQQLQNLVAREVCALDSAVISVCGLHSEGNAYNIIPDRVALRGTLRALEPQTRKYLQERIKTLSTKLCEAQRATCEVALHEGPPSLHNSAEWVALAKQSLTPILGAENIKQLKIATMGAEDFAYIKERYPGIFIRVGCRTQGKEFTPIHSGRFTVDRKALTTGLLTMAGLALSFCQGVADEQ